jgi:hypothetical protein
MSLLGIDIAWATPGVPDIKSTGAQWVARYFSQDPTKDLTAGEVQQYTAAGLGIVTVFETSAGRALQGHQAGAIDASDAIAERAAVGLPQDAVIYFAVDTDTTWASVQDYFDGVCTIIPKAQVGVYGGYQVAEGGHSYGLKYIWQTVAWSGGQWSTWATIKQTGGTVLSGGADIDYAEVPDFGQYPRPEDDVTPQDKQDIINGVKALLQDPTLRGLAEADNLWWLSHALQGTVPNGATPSQASSIIAIHNELQNLANKPVAPAVPPTA